MKIHDMPKVDRPREKLEKKMKKKCLVCGDALAVTVHADRTYAGGHYFGKIPLHTKKEMNRAIKAGVHPVRMGKHTFQVMNSDPKPYAHTEYWECDTCYAK